MKCVAGQNKLFLIGFVLLFSRLSLAAPATISFSPYSHANEMIVSALNSATSSILIANYHLSNHQILETLLKTRTDINITLILDRDMGKAAYQPLLNLLAMQKNISVYLLTNPLYHLMHLKCAVIDDHDVIGGTSNWSEDSFNANFEDTLLIPSESLAARYRQYLTGLLSGCTKYSPTAAAAPLKETSESWDAKPDLALQDTFRKTFDIAPDTVECFFSTENDIRQEIENAINAATQSMDIAVYYLSDHEILRTLLNKVSSNSLNVRIVVDGETLSFSSSDMLYELSQRGCQLYYNNVPRTSMHLKTAIFDNQTVVTGSANWTDSAIEKNVEDFLVIHNADVASYYKMFMDDIMSKCKPLTTYSSYDGTPTNFASLATYPFYFPTDPATFREPRKFESFHTSGYASYIQDGAYLETLLDLIRNAQQSILVSMFAVPARVNERKNLEEIVKALQNAHERGVYVYVVFDLPHDKKDGLYESHIALVKQLRDMGIEARLCIPPVELHEKLVVVDLCKVLLGNHNWSEGSLDGSGVLDSSALLRLNQQDIRFAEYIMGKNVIGDMSSEENMRREIDRYFFGKI